MNKQSFVIRSAQVANRAARATTAAACAAGVAAVAVAPATASQRSARAARTIALNETGRLRLTSKHGFTLNEEGSAVGVIRGKIYIHLKIVSTNRVTAEVSIYPNGGSLTGSASASYHVVGGTARFTGTMSIARGTGSYRTARGAGLGFSGTIARLNDAVTVDLTGNLSV
jgi:hypothetical protein